MKAKKFISVALTLCILISVAIAFPSNIFTVNADAAYNYSGGTRNSATFIIDPGHGGSDPGACSLGREEAADVLDLSIRVAKLVDGAGSSCSLTRVTDATQSLETKVSIANSGSFTYFLSIHRNAGGGKGIETYYYSGLSSSSTGAKLATSVQNKLIATGLWTNRGVKTAGFYVIKYTNMSAALVEVGFIDTASDNTIFANNKDTNARAIANGLLAMVGLSVSSSSTKYQSTLDQPGGAGASNATINASASVTQNGSSDNFYVSGWTLHSSGISNIQYNVDGGSYNNLSLSTRADVQAAIGGYSDYSNCGFTGNIPFGKLSGGTHTIIIRATTKANTTYNVANITLTVTDPINPTLSNIQISNVSTSGYRISCTVSDNAGVTKVCFPTWTDANGQDDIVWHEATISGSTAYYDVKTSEHNNEHGLYITHIYVYDGAGNTASGQTSVDLTPDTEDPSITNVSITNVTYFGFDVSCDVSDNQGVTKVQFPIWTEANDQDDIKWYEPTISGNKASIRINTSGHSLQTGAYNVHLYAWDAWNNSTCYETSVVVPTPVYPTDADYIPIQALNASQYTSNSMVWTTGTFTAQYWGVLVLESTTDGYKVIAKYNDGDTKSIVASATNPIIAVHSSLTSAYNAFSGVSVNDVITLEAVDVNNNLLISGAYAKLPAKFELVTDSGYTMNSEYLTLDVPMQTARDINNNFQCEVRIVDANGVAKSSETVAGTGYVVQRLSSTGTVLNSTVIIVKGDINGDGVVNTTDSVCQCMLVKGKASYGEAYSLAADMDGDDSISTMDLVLIKRACKG